MCILWQLRLKKTGIEDLTLQDWLLLPLWQRLAMLWYILRQPGLRTQVVVVADFWGGGPLAHIVMQYAQHMVACICWWRENDGCMGSHGILSYLSCHAVQIFMPASIITGDDCCLELIMVVTQI